jgi:hypothetical protein
MIAGDYGHAFFISPFRFLSSYYYWEQSQAAAGKFPIVIRSYPLLPLADSNFHEFSLQSCYFQRKETSALRILSETIWNPILI